MRKLLDVRLRHKIAPVSDIHFVGLRLAHTIGMRSNGALLMPQLVKRSSSVEHRQTLTLNEIFWRDISEPGAYVEVGSGDLYRFPKEAFTQGVITPGAEGKRRNAPADQHQR
jgi:hypothetical protein